MNFVDVVNATPALRAWLDYGSYVDLDRRILYVETPKVGATTIKSMLRALKTSAPVAFDPRLPETRLEMFVHNRAQFPFKPITALSGPALGEALTSPDWFRFCVVRDPVERFFSAWRDKVFLCEPGFERYLPADGQPFVEFEDFADQVLGREDPATCDSHWRAQTALLQPAHLNYTRIYTLASLPELTADLSRHCPSDPAAAFQLVRRNEGYSLKPADFVTAALAVRLHGFYQPDYAAFGFDKSAAFGPVARKAHEVVSDFTDAIFERNRIIGAHVAFAARQPR